MATWPKGFYVSDDTTKTILLPMGTSQTIALGDVLFASSGLMQAAAAADTSVAGVALQAQVSAASGVELIAASSDPYMLLVGTADGDMSTPVHGSEIDLVGASGSHQLDADASTTDIFTLVSKYHDRDQTISAAGLACLVRITAGKFSGV